MPDGDGAAPTVPTVWLSRDDARKATADMWQQTAINRAVDTYTPSPTDTPVPGAAPDLSPQRLTSVLKLRGWSDAAIQEMLGNTNFDYNPGYKSYSPSGMGTLATTKRSMTGPSQVTMYGRNGETAALGEADLAWTIEHEAHHSYDWLNQGVRDALWQDGSATLPQVYSDINALRQHAAVSANRELFDASNNALFFFHNDPWHLNHQLAEAAQISGAPDWYRQRYLSYLSDTPQWSGTPANTTSLAVDSPRAKGWPTAELPFNVSP